MPTIKKIGVLTGGGDAPGLNAVIRAVVKAAHNAKIQVVGLEDSFDGLIYPEKHLQERLYSILPFLARHGFDLIGTLYDNIRLDCPDHRLLVI